MRAKISSGWPGGADGDRQALGGAKHITGQERAGAEGAGQEFGLDAFANPGGAEQYQPPGPGHSRGRLEANSIATLPPGRAVTDRCHSIIMLLS